MTRVPVFAGLVDHVPQLVHVRAAVDLVRRVDCARFTVALAPTLAVRRRLFTGVFQICENSQKYLCSMHFTVPTHGTLLHYVA